MKNENEASREISENLSRRFIDTDFILFSRNKNDRRITVPLLRVPQLFALQWLRCARTGEKTKIFTRQRNTNVFFPAVHRGIR